MRCLIPGFVPRPGRSGVQSRKFIDTSMSKCHIWYADDSYEQDFGSVLSLTKSEVSKKVKVVESWRRGWLHARTATSRPGHPTRLQATNDQPLQVNVPSCMNHTHAMSSCRRCLSTVPGQPISSCRCSESKAACLLHTLLQSILPCLASDLHTGSLEYAARDWSADHCVPLLIKIIGSS
jgi:hypothetical protein